MAEASKNPVPEKKSGPEMVRVRVVTNYGRHKPNEWVEMLKADYAKFRLLESQGRHRVVISQADMDVESNEARKAEDERIKGLKRNDEHRDGWQKYQQESLARVKASRIQEQKVQMDVVLGSNQEPMTAEQQQAQFRERVAVSRTG
jgi:hypothetical protein